MCPSNSDIKLNKKTSYLFKIMYPQLYTEDAHELSFFGGG